jgi:UDP-GlcNAc:undecaprenyl-phosphate GlcNAc-1-phosphate transferase
VSAGWDGGLIAFLLVLVCTPVVRAVCSRWNVHDSPGRLKIHAVPTARLGGIAMAVALICGIGFESRHVIPGLEFWLAAFGMIGLAGVLDDTRGLSPFLRLAVQIGSGALLWLGGWRLPVDVPVVLNFMLVCAIVVLFVNSFNFLDGSDGLAAGVIATIAVAYIFACGGNTKKLGFIVAWSLLGACAGFLFFNFPPAKIFMGDSGSTLLGFCVAYLSIDFVTQTAAQPSATQWLFPVLVAAVPLADGIVVVLRRVKRGRSPLQGDRTHFYDRLLARGWSPRSVALGSYALTALLCAAALWTLEIGLKPVVILLGATVAGIGLVSRDRLSSHTSQERSERVTAN